MLEKSKPIALRLIPIYPCIHKKASEDSKVSPPTFRSERCRRRLKLPAKGNWSLTGPLLIVGGTMARGNEWPSPLKVRTGRFMWIASAWINYIPFTPPFPIPTPFHPPFSLFSNTLSNTSISKAHSQISAWIFVLTAPRLFPGRMGEMMVNHF
jgi:hypothetical protein